MPLRLFYITNDPYIAGIAQEAGADAIFLDLEMLGKTERQQHHDTVISRHTIDDVRAVRAVLNESDLLVRVNPMNPNSESEIDEAIDAGADILMLPMFRTKDDAEEFIHLVGNKAESCLLVETPEAVENIDDILAIPGIGSVHIGLNDLHLAYGMKFMFELLVNGTVDRLCRRIQPTGIRYGFGGIASLGGGLLPAEHVLIEHYRLGSTQVILSRSFCRLNAVNRDQLPSVFCSGIGNIRAFEHGLSEYTQEQFVENTSELKKIVARIVQENDESTSNRGV